MVPRPLFPRRQAQRVQAFLLKPAPFFKLFTGLGSTIKTAIVFLSPPRHLVCSPLLCPSISHSLEGTIFHPLPSRYNGSPLPQSSTVLCIFFFFFSLEACCLVKTLRHTGAISIHGKTCASSLCLLLSCLFVVTPPLPRDGGTTCTAIQVHAVNLI